MTTDRITRRGRIAYVSDQPDDKGTARGGEEFSITRFDDGRMIQRAHCRITAPPDVERDSVVAVDANLRPVDAYVRIETGGKFTGTGWYVFGSDSILCETQTAEGLMSYSRDVPRIGPLPFCSHAIAGDAWMIAIGIREVVEWPACVDQIRDERADCTNRSVCVLNHQRKFR